MDDREQLLREVLAERFAPRPLRRLPAAPVRREPIDYDDTDLDRAERRRILGAALDGAAPARPAHRRHAGLAPVVPLRRAS